MHYVMVVCQLLCFNFVFVEYSYTGVITQESGSHCTVKEEKNEKRKDEKLHISILQCILRMDNMPENK